MIACDVKRIHQAYTLRPLGSESDDFRRGGVGWGWDFPICIGFGQ